MRRNLVRRAGLAAIVMGALTASQGCVQVPEGERFGPRGGDTLLSLAASFSNLDADDSSVETTSAEADLAAGHFLSDQHEVGTVLSVRRTEFEVADADIDSTIYRIEPYYNFNVRSGERAFFYFGPHAGLQFYDVGGEDDTSLAYGAHVGMRHFLSPRTAVFVEPRFTRLEFDDDDASEFSILFGLLYRF